MASTGNDWLDKAHKSLKNARNIVYSLRSRAGAAALLGMEQLSFDLECMADDLDKHLSTINDSIGEAVTELCHQSMQHSATLLQAALAGCLVSAQDKEDKE